MRNQDTTLVLTRPEGALYRADTAVLYGRTIAELFADKVRADGPAGERGLVVDDEVLPYRGNAAGLWALLWSLYFVRRGDLWRALGRYSAIDTGRACYPVAPTAGFVDDPAAVVAALAGGTPLPPRFAGIFARVAGARSLPPPPRASGSALRDGAALQAPLAAPPLAAPPLAAPPVCGAILGARLPVEQYGILGRGTGAAVGVDLGGPLAVAIVGLQGSGKTNTGATLVEMATMALPGLNILPRPLAAMVIHYNNSERMGPEFAAMVAPATGPEAARLYAQYGATPRGLDDIVLLVPPTRLAQRQRAYPHLDVRALAFGPDELGQRAWRHLMNADGNKSVYMQKLIGLMRACGDDLTLDLLQDKIARASFSATDRERVAGRLAFALEYVRDGARLSDLIQPGRLIIADLRDPLRDRADALGVIMVLLSIMEAAGGGQEPGALPFNKMFVMPEAHRTLGTTLSDDVVEAFREVRHHGTSLLLDTQDPLSVARQVIELANLVVVHRCDSPAWLRYMARANSALGGLRIADVSALAPGEAYVWAREATNASVANVPIKVMVRPRVSTHGGASVRVDARPRGSTP